MRKIAIIMTVVVLLSALPAHAAEEKKQRNPNLDFSGMEYFWQVFELMQKDKQPPETLWKSLFETPGYRELASYERFSRDFIKKYYALAFMPSGCAEMKKELAKKDRNTPILAHYLHIADKKNEIIQQQQKLLSSSFMEKALAKAAAFMPESMVDPKIAPRVSFVIFANEAYRYFPMVFDLLYSIEGEEHLLLLVAHRSFLYYHSKHPAFSSPCPKFNPGAHRVVWILNLVQAWGIADHIDKPGLLLKGGLFENSPRARMYRSCLDDSPAAIKRLDQLLQELPGASGHPAQYLGKICKPTLPDGNPTGFYMAAAIMETLGKEVLIKTVGNPFAFFKLYQRAAQKKPALYTPFSAKTMELIGKLEKKYIIKR